jgi:molybdate transport system permease protein
MSWTQLRELWGPLNLSLRIAGAATAVGTLIGVPLALFMARRRFIGKSILEAMIVVPMVLPPTVVGFIILELMGTQSWVGYWLKSVFNFKIVFSFQGAVLAAAVVAFPMLYLPAKSGFASVEREMEDSARLMGANRWQVFWYVSLPLARRSIYSGLLLAFARALGEFGATVMVYGWSSDRLTLPISIYNDYEQGPDNLSHATAAVLALAAISMALTFAHNRSAASHQD